MTSLAVEHLCIDVAGREGRAVDVARERAAEMLGGRTVWCASAVPVRATRRHRLRDRLTGAGVAAEPLEVAADESLARLGERFLHGAAEWLGPEARELFELRVQAGDALVGDAVRTDDVVVFEDPLSALLAAAVRERGAHAIWHVRGRLRPERMEAREAHVLPARHVGAVDAFVTASRSVDRRGVVVDEVLALMPSADRLSAKEVEHRAASGDMPAEVGWSSLLADVLDSDRGETVGGTLHPRPAIAVR